MGIFLSMCLLATGMSAQTNIDFTKYTLDNGLKVILHQDATAPIVAVSIMYEVGGKDSFEGRTGFAHFFEHLLFEGSENIKRGEYAKYVEDAGGVLNANTSQDRTYYYEILPSNKLELGLWLESERLLHAVVDQEGVETQRKVVKEERRQRMDNQPYGSLQYELFRRGFKKHPYKDPNIGYMKDLNGAQEADYKRFYETYYVPNNAILSIAGDINVEQTKALINKYFASIPRGKDAPRVTVVEPELGGEVRDTVYYYAISMLNSVMSQGQSSRLNKVLVDQEQVAVQAGSFPSGSQDPGISMAFAVLKPGGDLEKAEMLLDREVKKMQTELISEKEFQKLRNQVEGIAENLANYEMYQGDANLINTETERYLKVTREDIKRVANKYYSKKNRVLLYWMPGEKPSK